MRLLTALSRSLFLPQRGFSADKKIGQRRTAHERTVEAFALRVSKPSVGWNKLQVEGK